eukprot:scpid91526/ scgid33305/ 
MNQKHTTAARSDYNHDYNHLHNSHNHHNHKMNTFITTARPLLGDLMSLLTALFLSQSRFKHGKLTVSLAKSLGMHGVQKQCVGEKSVSCVRNAVHAMCGTCVCVCGILILFQYSLH